MSEDFITLTGSSPELYEAGRIVAHCSDESGIPNVGISVGLGGGRMLYAGDLPRPNGVGLCIYTRDSRAVIADDVDYDAVRDVIEAISGAIINAERPEAQ